jgi:branched-chain amino acid transport system substrate-binding protein
MSNWKTAAGVLGALLVISSAGVSAQTRDPYKIGFTVPLSGPLANSGADYLPGAEIAVTRINAAGGVNGHPLQLHTEDSLGTPPGGVASMRKLVQVDGVQAMLTFYTNVVSAQIPLADELKVPILGAIQTPGMMSHSPYTFSHAETVNATGLLFGDYWKNHKVKRVYAFIPNNALGAIFSTSFKAGAAKAGVEYAEATFNSGETDYRGVVARAKDFNPDGVIVASPGGLDGTVLIRQVREAGIPAQIYLPGTFIDEPGWKAGVGSYFEGLIMAGVQIDPVAGKQFIADYQAKTGRPPGVYAAEVYDEVYMFAAAIKNGSYNGDAIAKQMAALKGVPSVFGGTITMDPEHYSVPLSNRLRQIRNGQLVLVN